MSRTVPPPFMSKGAARLVTPGNTEDHFDHRAECDWIVEAVLENAAVKQGLYARLEAVRKADAVVSSNTSTIPLGILTEGLPAAFRPHFLITHFFNPPRYRRLQLERASCSENVCHTVSISRAAVYLKKKK